MSFIDTPPPRAPQLVEQFVKHLNKSRKPLHGKPMYVETTKDEVEVQCAIQ